MKNWLVGGQARGPCTWNAVLPSTFTQFPGSALVADAAVGCAIGAIGSATTNGVVRGLDGRLSAKTRRRGPGPRAPYAPLASPIFRMSRLLNIIDLPSGLNCELRRTRCWSGPCAGRT